MIEQETSNGPGAERVISGIRKRNSVAFIDAVLAAYREGRLFALLDEKAAVPELAGYRTGNIIEPAPGGGWVDQTFEPRRDADPAQIVFTSGTEGKPKAVVISHAALADTVDRLNEIMNVDASIREYVGVPVTFSFGLGRCRAVATAGGKFFIPDNGFDPIEIREMLRSGEINALSAVPALLRLLLKDPQVLQGQGEALKWLEIGSQYMSRDEKEQVKALFPNAVIVQHYGLTEASRSTFLVISETAGNALESVGVPIGGVDIETRADGRIRLRGPHLALGLIVDGEISPVADEDGWLTTSDNGHFADGALMFDGRADDVINSGGVKVDPGQLEQEVLSELGAKTGLAIARIPDEARGEGFFIAVENTAPLDLTDVTAAVRNALARREIVAGSSVRAQHVDAIPATDTGKVRRKELAELYRKPEAVPATDASEQGGVRGLYAGMFHLDHVPDTASFQDLGGDSLNYVEMSIALESELGTLPQDWDILSVAELAKLEGASHRKPAVMETGIFLRALAISSVVAAHSGMLALGGGTFLLFFLIGYNLARFKAPALTEGKVASSFLAYARTLIIPYFLLAALYMVTRREFQVDTLFLYTNLTELRLTRVFPFWFVQVLIQCLAITALLFLVPAVRNFAKRSPWPFAFGLTACFVALWQVFPLIWDTDYLGDLVPQRYIALLWVGWCCFAANTQPRKVLALALGLAFAYLDSGISRNGGWIALGVVAMLYVPIIRVPRLLRSAIQYVSAATFTIFALNGLIAWGATAVLEKVLGSAWSGLVFVVTFAGCLVFYEAMKRLQGYVGVAGALLGKLVPGPRMRLASRSQSGE